ncbi:polysaccharide deactylase family protein, PEP-CTERM locus subfamily [Caldithrix abyssi DSM 13497]|uniref:Polysaccharide deacetylase family protein, PEP-CTERM locus subfamily n=1 Tax=Caldithrix abyssi DSM 13497 TaxID=880073 RepID=H1XW23_CALAY|nr:XrtA system polysaccharide deacetylase [Caldithrix abyssi]APF17713.1 polysaccharide deacetylase family protein, PEP-CTERM locus subfamily [Caldithrix abyssi DSM 13497]EHO41795.1 polysaccharide deactylase family protein, PEP-CTERM locus subfamily [Caldithrix abyssi DSM 13497]
MKNVLTVDVEEWFHPEALQNQFPMDSWPDQKKRLEPLIERLLEAFDVHRARATFFVLGWVAEQNPQIVKKIVAAGHEIASHSYAHRMVTKMSPDSFDQDLKKSIRVLEDIAGVRVKGFRAPTFSITGQNLWAFDVLAQNNLEYDSSIYPIWHDRYGMPHAPRTPFIFESAGGKPIVEFPMPTIRIGNKNIPFGGGGYLRLLPLWFTQYAIKKFNREGHPAIIYMHPWEFDSDQPRVPLGRLQSLRHYGRIKRNFNKLERLLKQFEWMAMEDYLTLLKKEEKLSVKKLNLITK